MDINQTRFKTVGIAMVGMLLFGVVGVSLYVNLQQAAPVFEDAGPTNAFNTLKGTVYLTLVENGDNAPDLFTLNVESLEVKRSFDETDSIRITEKVSPDGSKSAYMSALLDRSSPYAYASKDYFQLRVRDGVGDKTKQLTNSSLLYKRLGEWSPEGKVIAFTAQAPSTTNTLHLDPDQWAVHTVDMEGITTTIDIGTHPFWSPDGTKMLYMKGDGLYMFNLNDSNKKRVFPAPQGSTSISMKLDVSDDGKVAVWSQLGKIYVLDINSWEKEEVFMNRIIYTGTNVMYSPVLSPDSRYVLYKEADYNPTGEITNPNLVVYDLRESARKVLLPFNAYDFAASFISDWR